MKQEEIANKLMDEGFEAIENFQYEEAIKIGEKLKKIKHSSAFEILALAYHQEDNNPKAIEILQEGVRVAPVVWRLWQLLGNYQSENQLYEESQNSFQKARECPDPDLNSISYNSSLEYLKGGNYKEAKNQCSLVDCSQLKAEGDHELLIFVLSLNISISNNLGQFEESKTIFNSTLSEKIDFDSYNQAVSDLYTSYAETLFKTGNSKEALEYLWKAIELHKNNGRASWLIREIEGRFSENSKYFRILIEGVWHQPFEGESENPGFYTSYDVVADTLDDALDLIKRFEPTDIEHSLKIDEHEILENIPENPQGIYSTSGYSFFTE